MGEYTEVESFRIRTKQFDSIYREGKKIFVQQLGTGDESMIFSKREIDLLSKLSKKWNIE